MAGARVRTIKNNVNVRNRPNKKRTHEGRAITCSSRNDDAQPFKRERETMKENLQPRETLKI